MTPTIGLICAAVVGICIAYFILKYITKIILAVALVAALVLGGGLVLGTFTVTDLKQEAEGRLSAEDSNSNLLDKALNYFSDHEKDIH